MPQNGQRSGSGGARRLHEVETFDLGRRGFRHPAHRRREHQRQRDHAVTDAAAHRAGDRHRQQHGGKRVEHVHRAHDRGVHAFTGEAADDAEAATDDRGDADRHHAHQQGDSAAIQQPGQQVAAQLVGAQKMALPSKRLQPADDAFPIWIERRQPRREDRRQHDQQHDGTKEHRHGIVAQPIEDAGPIAADLQRGRDLLVALRGGAVENRGLGHGLRHRGLGHGFRTAGCADRSWTAADRPAGLWRRTPSTAPGSCLAAPARRG